MSVVARALGPAGQGLFAVAFTLSLLLVQFGGLGLTTANSYFAARDPAARPRIVGNAVWFAVGLGLALVAVGRLLKVVAPDAVEGLGWTPLLVTLAGIPGGLAAFFLQAVLLGEGRMVAYNAVDVAQAALTLAGPRRRPLRPGRRTDRRAARHRSGPVRRARSPISRSWPAPARRRFVRISASPATMLRYGFRVYIALLVSLLVDPARSPARQRVPR